MLKKGGFFKDVDSPAAIEVWVDENGAEVPTGLGRVRHNLAADLGAPVKPDTGGGGRLRRVVRGAVGGLLQDTALAVGQRIELDEQGRPVIVEEARRHGLVGQVRDRVNERLGPMVVGGLADSIADLVVDSMQPARSRRTRQAPPAAEGEYVDQGRQLSAPPRGEGWKKAGKWVGAVAGGAASMAAVGWDEAKQKWRDSQAKRAEAKRARAEQGEVIDAEFKEAPEEPAG